MYEINIIKLIFVGNKSPENNPMVIHFVNACKKYQNKPNCAPEINFMHTDQTTTTTSPYNKLINVISTLVNQ